MSSEKGCAPPQFPPICDVENGNCPNKKPTCNPCVELGWYYALLRVLFWIGLGLLIVYYFAQNCQRCQCPAGSYYYVTDTTIGDSDYLASGCYPNISTGGNLLCFYGMDLQYTKPTCTIPAPAKGLAAPWVAFKDSYYQLTATDQPQDPNNPTLVIAGINCYNYRKIDQQVPCLSSSSKCDS